MNHRIVFMGSPEFALPSLHRLAENYEIAGVVTQPDRKSGRGRKLTPPPVKTAAHSLGLPVIQPPSLRDPEAMDVLENWSPSVIVVAAFGQILRKPVLNLPAFGCINVHASLLPRWRGASPIHHAILHGDSETGVTIMKMDEGLDTGPILSRSSIPISPDETTGDLSEKLADLGAKLLIRTLPDYINGAVRPVPQSEEGATYAPMLKKQDGQLDFSQPAEVLARKVRAFAPWPGTYFEAPRGLIKVHSARAVTGNLIPGRQVVKEGLPGVGTSDGILVFEALQPAGKTVMRGDIFLQGAQDWTN